VYHISIPKLIFNLLNLLRVYFYCVIICRISIPCVSYINIELSKLIIIINNKGLMILIIVPFLSNPTIFISDKKLGHRVFFIARFWHHVEIVGFHRNINIIISSKSEKIVSFLRSIVIFLVIPYLLIAFFYVTNLILRKTFKNVRRIQNKNSFFFLACI
jgi:hypothetical protein